MQQLIETQATTAGRSSHEGEEFGGYSSQGEFMVNTSRGTWSLAPSLVGLKILVIRGPNLNQVIPEVFRKPFWLRWLGIGQKDLSSGVSLENLRVLELSEEVYGEHHLQELWASDRDAPLQLTELTIRFCSRLQNFPNSIGCLKNLKKIIVQGDWEAPSKMESLPEEFCLLKSLEHLEFTCCKLSSLPNRFGDLKNLRFLCLSNSTFGKMSSLPDSFKSLALLRCLRLRGFQSLNLDPDILEYMTKLTYLDLYQCMKLKELPRHITNLASLTELNLQSIRGVRDLPVNIGQLSKLRVLNIGSDLLTSLPTSLGDLSSLRNLKFQECPRLESLPASLGDLSSLTTLTFEQCRTLKSLPTSLGTLFSLTSLTFEQCQSLESLPTSLGDLSSLNALKIEECPKLESLPDSMGCLDLLENLEIFHSGVKSLPKSFCQRINLEAGPFTSSLSNLNRIYLTSTKVSKISISEDCCAALETLKLHNNEHLREIEILPTTVKNIELLDGPMVCNVGGIGSLVNIRKLNIDRCPKLNMLPSFAQLASLQEFHFAGCYQVKKMQDLEHCRALEELIADTRWEVAGIESLERMERLRRVQLITLRGSGVKACIPSMQKWVEEIIQCTRANPDAASILNSLAFPTVSIVDSISNQEIDWDQSSKLVQSRYLHGHNIMVCIVMNCVSPGTQLQIDSSMDEQIFSAVVDEGKWLLIGVFTQRSRWHTTDYYSVTASSTCVLEKALLVMGKEQELEEAFGHLWKDLVF